MESIGKGKGNCNTDLLTVKRNTGKGENRVGRKKAREGESTKRSIAGRGVLTRILWGLHRHKGNSSLKLMAEFGHDDGGEKGAPDYLI